MGRITRLRNVQPVTDATPAAPAPALDKFAIQRVNSGDYLAESEKGFLWVRDYSDGRIVSFTDRAAAQPYMVSVPMQPEGLRIARLPTASALLKE